MDLARTGTAGAQEQATGALSELAAHEVVALGVAVRLAAGDFGGQEHVGAGQARVLDGPPDGLLVAVRFRRVLVAISAERK